MAVPMRNCGSSACEDKGIASRQKRETTKPAFNRDNAIHDLLMMSEESAYGK
jgi:hypothetical protein